MRIVVLSVALLCPTALAADADFATWAERGIGVSTERVYAGQWLPKEPTIVAVDPLTMFGADGPEIAVPQTEAAVIGLLEDVEDGRTAVMALVWSDAPVLCGEEVTVIGVDTGLAAFLTAADVAALERYGRAYDNNLYNGPYAEQIDTLYPGPFLTDLPDGTSFPLSGSGWGDGGYPVTALYAEGGDMVALFAQFITDGEKWLTPPPCASSIS